MWESNRTVLRDRFPDVLAAFESAPAPEAVEWLDESPSPTLRVHGIQLTGAYDRRSEASEQSDLIAASAQAAWVYGFGLGDLPRELLARSELKQLNVVVLNCALGRICCDRIDHTDWLRDSRVHLVLGRSEEKLNEPFAALPGELMLAEDECARLRDLVRIELASPWVAQRMNERSVEFEATIFENSELLAADGDVAELFGTHPGGTIFIAAAGPSLEASFEFLHGRSEPLIAVGAAIRPLLDAGIRPDTTVVIDAHQVGVGRQFDTDLKRVARSTLVYYPVVPRQVLESWPGRRLVAYGVHPRWSDLFTTQPKGRLWGAGTVTHVAIDLAVRMGASRIVLFGCDFGFADGRTHAHGNPYEVKVDRATAASNAVTGTWVHDVNGNRLATLPNLCSYLRDLESYIAVHPEVTFVNASRTGAAIAGTQSLEEAALEY